VPPAAQQKVQLTYFARFTGLPESWVQQAVHMPGSNRGAKRRGLVELPAAAAAFQYLE